jgi:hypothetical protein
VADKARRRTPGDINIALIGPITRSRAGGQRPQIPAVIIGKTGGDSQPGFNMRIEFGLISIYLIIESGIYNIPLSCKSGPRRGLPHHGLCKAPDPNRSGKETGWFLTRAGGGRMLMVVHSIQSRQPPIPK